MISFINKTIAAPEHIPRTPGKRVAVKVIWKNNKFIGRIDKQEIEIDGWNYLSESKWIYALPTNTYYTPWSRKLYQPPDKPDKDILAMTLRFWGKYWSNMTIYGKIEDGIFYQSKKREDNEPDISEATTE